MSRCLRCDGKGKLSVVVGYPGQDRRTTPYKDIKWREPVIMDPCPVCLGGGFRPARPPRKRFDGAIHIHATNVTFEELVALLPVKEESDDRNEESPT